MDFDNWLLFASIALVAAMTPGPAILLVTSHAVAHGLPRAVFTALGNISGLLLMSALSVWGLSTLLLYSAPVFLAIKLVGAGYLIYLGVKLWRNGLMAVDSAHQATGGARASAKRLYLNGLLIALSNPKAIAFTGALFPQFIDHTRAVLPQLALMVPTFMAMSFGCLMVYGAIAVRAGRRVRHNPSRWPGRVFGSVFIVSGLVLASAGPR